MSRKPAKDRYDLLVGLEPTRPGEIPRFTFALAKFTYVMQGGQATLAPPEPLAFDVYGDNQLEPRLPPGSDYWLDKAATDVVVLGSAHTPGGRPGSSMRVQVTVGHASKRIDVFGRREIVRTGRELTHRSPEPFTEMPLGYENAYGGFDPRVPLSESDHQAFVQLALAGQAVDHPGLYPRNPIGKGYIVYPDLIEGLEMPNLEDPDDRLTMERLVVGAPELWYRQPLPWALGWTNGLMYPRELHAGFDAWFPCPDERELAEVRRGFLPPGVVGSPRTPGQIAPEYYQEASLGLALREPLEGLQTVITGMHPEEPSFAFRVPAAPRIEVLVDGVRYAPRPTMTNLVIRPAEKTFYIVYCVKTGDLPRAFIPQIHKDIPLFASVDGEPPVRYESPPTIRDRLAASAAQPAPVK